jgi:hypothetical protein
MQVALSGSGLAPVVTLSTSSLTFSAQLVNTSSPQQAITLTNSGDAALNISSIFAFFDFAQTNNCGSKVVPGASCTINVTFTPAATGTRNGTLNINDDPSAGTQQTVSLSGTGVAPAAVLTPGSLTFSPQIVGTSSAAQSMTLSNPGSATLVINSILASAEYSQTNNCGSNLAPGASCSINVVFTPAASGNRPGTVYVYDNTIGGSPQTPGLSGTGVDFGLSATPSSVTISAGQTASYTVTAAALGGTFGSSVSLSCSGLPAASSCSFTPSAVTPGSGSVNSTLRIVTTVRHKSSGTPAGQYTITVTGTSGSTQHSTNVNLTVN